MTTTILLVNYGGPRTLDEVPLFLRNMTGRPMPREVEEAVNGLRLGMRTTSLVADDLLAEPLDKYKVVYCVNLPALTRKSPSGSAAMWPTAATGVDLRRQKRRPEERLQPDEPGGRRSMLPAPLRRGPRGRCPGRPRRLAYQFPRPPASSPGPIRSSRRRSTVRSGLQARGDGCRPRPDAWVLAKLDDGTAARPASVEQGKVRHARRRSEVGWSQPAAAADLLAAVGATELDWPAQRHVARRWPGARANIAARRRAAAAGRRGPAAR